MSVSPAQNFSKPPPVPEVPTVIFTFGFSPWKASWAACANGAIVLEPSFAEGHLYLAKTLLDTGDLSGAEAEARQGLAAGPKASAVALGHYVLADVYSRLGRPRDAAREAATGLRLEQRARTSGGSPRS